jgi:hypothetical protein
MNGNKSHLAHERRRPGGVTKTTLSAVAVSAILMIWMEVSCDKDRAWEPDTARSFIALCPRLLLLARHLGGLSEWLLPTRPGHPPVSL